MSRCWVVNSVALLAPLRSVQFSSTLSSIITFKVLRLALASLCFPLICHTMGVLPSTQPVATLGSSFILSSFDMACTCCVPYVEATAFGVDMNVGCDDCNDDGRTSPGSAIAMERGEASTVRMGVRKIKFCANDTPSRMCLVFCL